MRRGARALFESAFSFLSNSLISKSIGWPLINTRSILGRSNWVEQPERYGCKNLERGGAGSRVGNLRLQISLKISVSSQEAGHRGRRARREGVCRAREEMFVRVQDTVFAMPGTPAQVRFALDEMDDVFWPPGRRAKTSVAPFLKRRGLHSAHF